MFVQSSIIISYPYFGGGFPTYRVISYTVGVNLHIGSKIAGLYFSDVLGFDITE